MQKWLDLLTPSAAAIAILVALALLVATIKQGRAIKRLEDRVADTDGAAARVSLDRLSTLGRRAGRPGPVELRSVLAVLVGLAVVGTAGWYLFLRDDAAAKPSATSTRSTNPNITEIDKVRTAPDPNPKPLAPNKAAFKILVLNASGIDGAAGNGVTPIVASLGYATAPPGNATRSDMRQSVVVELPNKASVADNIAKDLGITRLMSLDGVVPAGYDLTGVDAIVVVGKDLAAKYRP